MLSAGFLDRLASLARDGTNRRRPAAQTAAMTFSASATTLERRSGELSWAEIRRSNIQV